MKKNVLSSLFRVRIERRGVQSILSRMHGSPMNLSPSPNIQLGLFEEFHADELFHLIDSDRGYLREWLPWLDTQRSVDDSMQFIRIIREQYFSGESMTLGIWYQKILCGVIGYPRFDWTNRAGMIGYWLASRTQGNGIMTESCRAMIRHGFDSLKLHRIDIRCATGNLRSCAIPERLGFVKEGILRDGEWLYDHFVDLVVYSLLAPDWKKSQH